MEPARAAYSPDSPRWTQDGIGTLVMCVVAGAFNSLLVVTLTIVPTLPISHWSHSMSPLTHSLTHLLAGS